MNLNNCTFARPIAKLSDALIRDLEEHGPEGLSEQHDALLTMAAGVAPGRPEVFTSCAARDAALGDYGPYTQFVRASWNEASAAGFEVQDIAIGHHLGDPAFDLIAPQVLDAVARGMAESESIGTLVIARVTYQIRVTPRGIAIVGVPEFGVEGDAEKIAATSRYLQPEFLARLGFPRTS